MEINNAQGSNEISKEEEEEAWDAAVDQLCCTTQPAEMMGMAWSQDCILAVDESYLFKLNYS